jgi:hypothetical protein
MEATLDKPIQRTASRIFRRSNCLNEKCPAYSRSRWDLREDGCLCFGGLVMSDNYYEAKDWAAPDSPPVVTNEQKGRE